MISKEALSSAAVATLAVLALQGCFSDDTRPEQEGGLYRCPVGLVPQQPLVSRQNAMDALHSAVDRFTHRLSTGAKIVPVKKIPFKLRDPASGVFYPAANDSLDLRHSLVDTPQDSLCIDKTGALYFSLGARTALEQLGRVGIAVTPEVKSPQK